MQSWLADSGGDSETGDGASTSSGTSNTSAAEAAAPPASKEALTAFLLEQGLSGREAERLAATLAPETADGSSRGGGDEAPSTSGSTASSSGSSTATGMSLSQLQAKWMGLQRVLPDANIAEMVS